MKTCATCKHTKALSEFSADASKADGLRTTCKRCDAETKLAYRYKMTHEDYQALLSSQGHVCAICRASSDKMTVDHDHACCAGEISCGECIRGLLCDSCNRAIGLMNENVFALEMAIKYLREGK